MIEQPRVGPNGQATSGRPDAASPDYYLIDELLTDDERAVRDRVRSFCEKQVAPIIDDYWERGEFPFQLIPPLAEVGVVGGTIEGHGCPGLSTVGWGLVNLELARSDASIQTFYNAHSGLTMSSIAMLGSDEQRRRWLPAMAKLEKVGAFALTEPEHGSDAVALATRARRDGDHYVLDGAKRWIGNGSFADVVIVWARDDEGDVGGFVVEKDAEGQYPDGYDAEVMTGKISKRAVWQAQIALRGVRVPAANRLAESRTFKDTTRVLTAGRSGVGWTALGHAVAAYEVALRYTRERQQFGRPIAASQLVQDKLARMLAEITAMQLLSLRLSRLAETGKMTAGMGSLAKLNNCRKARQIVADARDLLGGNGILLEYGVARHFADMEAVFTYEGTDHVQTLIVGREITGFSAFT